MNGKSMFAAFLSLVAVLYAGLIAIPIFVYLPLHSSRFVLSAGVLTAGFVAAVVIYRLTARPNRQKWLPGSILLTLACPPVLPVTSMAIHSITYSRFGLTVYGVVPVPFLDIRINKNGRLWFREKTHRITRDEIDRLMGRDVEVVVVGIGWDSIARVDDDVFTEFSDVDIRVLPTPDAFILYNSLVSQGRVVVLIAHSTCCGISLLDSQLGRNSSHDSISPSSNR